MGNSIKYKGVAAKHSARVNLIGDLFEGYLEPGEYTGHGTIKYTNKSVYQGEFTNGKPHGGGTITFPNGRKINGEFKEGVLDGTAEISDIEGNVFKGIWKDNRLHGQATYTTTASDVYEFVYEEGVRVWARKALVSQADMVKFLKEISHSPHVNLLV
jgi:hypothetical protein